MERGGALVTLVLHSCFENTIVAETVALCKKKKRDGDHLCGQQESQGLEGPKPGGGEVSRAYSTAVTKQLRKERCSFPAALEVRGPRREGTDKDLGDSLA